MYNELYVTSLSSYSRSIQTLFSNIFANGAMVFSMSGHVKEKVVEFLVVYHLHRNSGSFGKLRTGRMCSISSDRTPG